jgi:uncharacterized protein YcbK (DUF882 family)
MPAPIRSLVTLLLVLVPAVAAASPRAQAKPHKKQARTTTPTTRGEPKPRGCVKAPVEVVAGAESATFSLARCDGAAAPAGVDRLSTLARAHGGVRLDPRLVEELELAVDHFRKGTESARLVLVSGYRPRSAGSYHAAGRALDFRIDGVANEAIVAFCKTLPDTGCGYYPNSGFVHIDVRDAGTGHIAWTDVSRPGESPHYVTVAPAVASTLPALPSMSAGRAGEDEKVESAGSSAARERTKDLAASQDERAHAM